MLLGKRGSFEVIDEDSESDEFDQYVPEKFKKMQDVSLNLQRAQKEREQNIPSLEDLVLQSDDQEEEKEDLFGSFEDFDIFGDLDEDKKDTQNVDNEK